jgi:biotin synthase-like enzyme
MQTTYFGRCIFLSWYCERASCKFCFRSTTKHKIKHAQNAKRSLPSILTDAIIGKKLGWKIEFLTGGYGIFDFKEIVNIAKLVSSIYNEKIWVNLGALKKAEMIKLKPYVEGICASIETIEPKLHNKVCPDKKIKPYSDMLKTAKELGFKTSITIVIGLGEKKEDFKLLKNYIEKYKLDNITFYALKPVKETEFEHVSSPKPEYYAWWIKQTRKAFPKIKIMAGLTPKKVDYTKLLLESGATAITKFPAIRQFNSEKAKLIEKMAKEADRNFTGSLTKIPEVNWDREIEKIKVNKKIKEQVKEKLEQSLIRMKKDKLSN